MSIKTKIIILTVLSLVVTTTIGLILFQNSLTIEKEIEKQGIITEARNKLFERAVLRNEYFLYREERPIAQLQINSEALQKLLMQASNIETSADEQVLISRLGDNVKFVDQTLSQIVVNFKTEPSSPSASANELEQRLISQILIKSQENFTISVQLSEASRNKVTESQQRATFFILVSVVGIILIIIFALYFIWLSIAKPLLALKESALRIASLDFSSTTTTTTTGKNSNDEIGQLARAFNDMSAKLKKSYETEQIAKLFSESIIDSIRSNIIVTDKHGVVTALNPAAERMWGIKKKETLGKDFFTLDLRGMAAGLKKDMEKVMRTKQTFHVKDLTYKTLAGEESFIDISYVPLLDAQGNLQGAVSVGDDTTETRRLRKNLQRLEKLAIIGKLAGVVGHEIRNPLGIIRASIYFINLKLKDSLDEKVKKHMHIMETEINAADKIISDILGFARIKEPVLQDAEINSVVQETLAKAGISKMVRVQAHLGENLPKVKVDVLQIKQVFSNLISNALQAMPQGGKLIVTTRKINTSLFIAFQDTGAGIPKENLDKLFTPLFTTKVKGIGLGLITCQIIVEGHQGKIEVESKEGKGSTFTVTLPLA